jgi:excinuclease UvrABC nuclease subunit
VDSSLASRLWVHVAYRPGSVKAVPAVPGVYAIAGVFRELGLPLALDVRYVGQTTNLRRRFAEHLRRGEPNAELRGLRSRLAGAELWYLPADRGRLDEIEALAIRALLPHANRRIPT